MLFESLCLFDVVILTLCFIFFFFFKQKTAYEMRISDWSSDVCSSDLTEKKKKDPIRWTGPILAGGRLIAVNSEGTLAEYSPTDGSLLASTEFDSSLSQSPIVANNILYILSDDGKITAWR